MEAPDVTISGLTFYENNFADPHDPAATELLGCEPADLDRCAELRGRSPGGSNTAAGDQGENGVTVSDNLFIDTGGSTSPRTVSSTSASARTGQDEDVTSLDTSDVVQDNVDTYDAGFEDQFLQMADTTGALVTGNTITYPADDDTALSAMWITGPNRNLVVSDNNLNGGGIDSDVTALESSQARPEPSR